MPTSPCHEPPGLALSLDGTRLVSSLATLSPDSTKYVAALWEIDPRVNARPGD